MSGSSSGGLMRSWFGLWVGLPFFAQLALVEGVFFRGSGAVTPYMAGVTWTSLEQIGPAYGVDAMLRMKAAVLTGLVAAAVGAVYLVLLFLLSARRGERFGGDFTTVLLALLFPAAALAFIFLVPDAYTKPIGSRMVLFRPDVIGLFVLSIFLYAISFFSALALLGVYGIAQRVLGGREPQAR